MKRKDFLYYIVKNNNHLRISIDVARSFIKEISKECYSEYYIIRIGGTDNEYKVSVYLKIKDNYNIYAFTIYFYEAVNYSYVEYDYGINDCADRIILKWVTLFLEKEVF